MNNKLTLAAAALATSTVATKIQAEAQFFDAIGDWFENDFVDFWVEDVGGAFEDIGEWFETDFVDFWTDDFVDFWTEDFVGFFEDLGDWFAGDFANWWKEDFVDFWVEEVPEFFTQEIPEHLFGGLSDEEIAQKKKLKAEYEAALAK